MAITKSYIDKATLQSLSQPSDLWGAWLTFHVWAVIISAGAFFIAFPNPITFIFAVLIIGSRQHGLSILVHEAAHGVLFKTRALNEWVGKYLLAAPYGGNMLLYRKYHLQHHKYAQSERDPDLALSSKYPVSKESLKRKFIRDITGQTFLRLRIAQFKSARLKAVGKDAIKIEGAEAFETGSPWPSIIANIIMFSALSLAGVWWAYFALWVLPLATWFFLVIRLRNIAEHAMTTFDENPLTHARTVKVNLLERIFFAPYWVNYHVEHHAYMFIPCHKFPALHKALHKAGWAKDMEIQKGYASVLKLATQ